MEMNGFYRKPELSFNEQLLARMIFFLSAKGGAGHECEECLGTGGYWEECSGHHTGRRHREGPSRPHGQLCMLKGGVVGGGSLIS